MLPACFAGRIGVCVPAGECVKQEQLLLVHQAPPPQVGAINDLIFQRRIQLQLSARSSGMQPDPGPPPICASPSTECTEKFQFTCFSFSPFPDLLWCIIQKTIQMGKTLALKQKAGGRKRDTASTPSIQPFALGRNRPPGAGVELWGPP